MKRIVLLIILGCVCCSGFAQLAVTPNNNATQLAQALVGPGVIVTNATLSCPTNFAGTFTATGGEEFVIIGNFLPYDKLKRKRVSRIKYPLAAYYFIDDICLTPVFGDGCIEIMR